MSQKHHRKDELLAIPVASRPGWLAVEKGRLEVGGHSLALVRETDVVEIPPAAFAALLLEPGASITYDAVKLCAENRTALLWVGEDELFPRIIKKISDGVFPAMRGGGRARTTDSWAGVRCSPRCAGVEG